MMYFKDLIERLKASKSPSSKEAACVIEALLDERDAIRAQKTTEKPEKMERLTEQRFGQWVIPLRHNGKQKWFLCKAGIDFDGSTEFLYGDHADRLAAYEDTGLEPEEIANLKGVFNESAILKLAAQYLNTTPDRLYVIAQAEKDGRLVVLKKREANNESGT